MKQFLMCISIYLLSYSTLGVAEDFTLVVDLANQKMPPVVYTDTEGSVLVKVINAIPARRVRQDYSISVHKSKLDGRLRYSDRFLRSSFGLETGDSQPFFNATEMKGLSPKAKEYVKELDNYTSACTVNRNEAIELHKSISGLSPDDSDGENKVRGILSNIKEKECGFTVFEGYDQLDDSDKSSVRNAHDKALASVREHNRVIGETFENATKDTTIERLIVISRNYDVTIEVATSQNGVNSTWAQFIYRGDGEESRWLTHYGFSFSYNRGDSFYSKKHETKDDNGSITETYYTVEKQLNKPGIVYSPTILWTYPFRKQDASINHGFTGGLGANEDSVMVIFGYSLIVGKNLIANLGVSAQEFSTLNGAYYEHQRLDSSVDSSALEEKAFDGSVGLSIGFRF